MAALHLGRIQRRVRSVQPGCVVQQVPVELGCREQVVVAGALGIVPGPQSAIPVPDEVEPQRRDTATNLTQIQQRHHLPRAALDGIPGAPRHRLSMLTQSRRAR
jgi:hypothetical protein